MKRLLGYFSSHKNQKVQKAPPNGQDKKVSLLPSDQETKVQGDQSHEFEDHNSDAEEVIFMPLESEKAPKAPPIGQDKKVSMIPSDQETKEPGDQGHEVEGQDDEYKALCPANKPSYYCGLRNEKDEPIPLSRKETKVEVVGYTAHVETHCWFTNHRSNYAEEVIFNFPLESEAALFDFRAELNGQLVIAEIKGKEAAKKVYERAIQDKKTAALLSEKNDYSEVFEIKLGALPKGQTIKLSFTYARELTINTGNNYAQFIHKDTLDTTYEIDEVGQVQVLQRQVSFQEEQDQEQTQSGCHSEVTISSDSNIEIKGENEELFQRSDVNNEGCTLRAKSDQAINDLVMNIYPADGEPLARIEPGLIYPIYPEGFLGKSIGMLNYATEDPKKDAVVISEEFIFLVDRSGSMEGPLIKEAIDTVELFLMSLPRTRTLTGYNFNIVSFGSDFAPIWEKSQPCTIFNVRKALQVVRGFDADLGGTDLLRPLKWAMGTQSKSNRSVIVVTDGAVANTNEVITYCNDQREKSKNTMIYAFGIGNYADQKLVGGVASNGMGLMIKKFGLEQCVKLAMAGVLCELYHNIKVKFVVPNNFSVTTLDAPKVLIPGRQLVVFAEITKLKRPVRRQKEDFYEAEPVPTGHCEITLTTPDGNPMHLKVDMELVVDHKYRGLLGPLEDNYILLNELVSFVDRGLPIHRLAARRKILDWSFIEGEEPKIAELSIETNILSPVTSFVAVIDGKDVIAEGKGPGLEYQQRSANDAYANDQPKFFEAKGARAEMCILEDGMLPSSSGDSSYEGGVECFKICNQPESGSDSVVKNNEQGFEEVKDDSLDFQMFGMVYRTCFSRLASKYCTVSELVSAIDLYREVLDLGINQDDWAGFIKRRLTLITVVAIWDGKEYLIKANAYGSVDDLISSICKALSITKDKLGDIKVAGDKILSRESKTLIELGFRNMEKLLVDKQ